MSASGKAIQAKLLSRSAYIFAIRFFPALATLAVAVIFAHRLPKATVGFYQNFWVNATVFQALAFFGLPALILTHSVESLNRWMSALKPLHVALGALWLLIVTAAFLFFLKAPDSFNKAILGALFLTQALCLLLESIGMVQGRFRILALNSFFYALIFLAAHFLVIEKTIPFKTLFTILLIIQIARLVSYAGLVRSGFQKIELSSKTESSSRSLRKQWRDLGLYDVFLVCARWLDKLIVAQIVAPAVLSIYVYGTTDIPFVALLLGAAGTGLLQQMAVGSGTKQETMKLVRYSGGVLARLVFPIFFFFLFFREEFIVTLFSASYIKAVPLFAISICTMPLRAYSFTTLLQHYNRVGLINIGAVLDLIISIGLAYPLYKWLGLSGMALAFVVGTYVQAVFYLYSTSKILRCSMAALIPGKTWLITLTGFALAGWLSHECLSFLSNQFLRLISGFAIMAFLAGISLLELLRKNIK
jgi:O-antigen/teichoic acid export membrane protein